MCDPQPKLPRPLTIYQHVNQFVPNGDESVRLFYRFYAQTIVGSKWLCVVVKYTIIDAFIITTYLTDKPKVGEEL